MLLSNMDEALEEKPSFCLEGKQLELAKLNQANVGQKFKMTCTAIVTEIEQVMGPDGIPQSEVKFEMDGIGLEADVDPMDTINNMYPSNK